MQSPTPSGNSVKGFVAGLASSVMLAVVWNVLGFAPLSAQKGYELTHYFTPITLSFVIAFAVVALLLGGFTRTTWPVGLGMIFTLPIACGVEFSQDSTSHNLVPFEILLTWLPGFLLASWAASGGRWLRGQMLARAT
jgi:hypothetical protein